VPTVPAMLYVEEGVVGRMAFAAGPDRSMAELFFRSVVRAHRSTTTPRAEGRFLHHQQAV
jgi:hypothetical protein